MLFIVPFHAEILGIQGNEQHAKINFSTQKAKHANNSREIEKRWIGWAFVGQVRVLNGIE